MVAINVKFQSAFFISKNIQALHGNTTLVIGLLDSDQMIRFSDGVQMGKLLTLDGARGSQTMQTTLKIVSKWL
jgi:hypothetical protein